MAEKTEKTNVMRLLAQKHIPFESRNYEGTGAVSGTEVAEALNEDPSTVFKTLVTVSPGRRYYVFVIPSDRELDLKKAAFSASEKSISMLPQKDLLPLTGYIHGGCSPIGMKKLFPTWIDESAKKKDHICVSAGKIGFQVVISADSIQSLVPFSYAELCKDLTDC